MKRNVLWKYGPAVAVALLSQVGSARAVGEIALDNPGFENDLNNWIPVTEKFKGQISVATGIAHSGTKSLRIEGKTNTPYLLRSQGGLEGGATYRMSAWVYSDNAPNGTQAALKLEFYNDQGKNTAGVYGQKVVKADGKWTQVEVTSPADPDTTRVSLYCRVYGPGVVYFDDIKFEQLLPAPDIVLQQPTRIAAKPGIPVAANFTVWLRKPVEGAALPAFTYEITGPNGVSTVTPQVKRLDPQRYELSAPLPALEGGDYAINVKSGNFSLQSPGRIFVTAKNRQPKFLTDTGTILLNGKPFFPIGMYHPYKTEIDYPLLAANGFNAVQGNGTHDMDALKANLDLAAKYGLAVDVPFYSGLKVKDNMEFSLEKIRRFANHPAVLCWKIIDEPDIQSNSTTADEVPAAYRAFKAADPNHPIELTMANDATLPYWSNFCDIVQIDRYPVPSRPLTDVSDFSKNAVAAKEPWQNLTYVVQSGWVADLSNQPTVPQARSMVYLALISGAKGIFWYSMREPSWDITTTPFWPRMKEINAEIQQLATPIMLGEDVKGLTVDNPKVHVLGKQHDGKLYVLITNPENAAVKATLNLPANLKLKNVQTLNKEGKAPVTGRKMKLDLDAIDSRTLIFEVG